MARLTDRQIPVFPVLQNLVCAQAIQRSAFDVTRKHGSKAVIDRREENDLRIREVCPHEIILHAIVFVDSKTSRRCLVELPFINDCRGR